MISITKCDQTHTESAYQGHSQANARGRLNLNAADEDQVVITEDNQRDECVAWNGQ